MQPCFTPAKQVKASVNLLSILTAIYHLSTWILKRLGNANVVVRENTTHPFHLAQNRVE